MLYGTPDEVIKMWLVEEMLDEDNLSSLFQVTDSVKHLVYMTTEDDPAPEHLSEWISYMESKTTVEADIWSTAWDLKLGTMWREEAPDVACHYLVGQGQFESSFPLLVFHKKHRAHFESSYDEWVADNA